MAGHVEDYAFSPPIGPFSRVAFTFTENVASKTMHVKTCSGLDCKALAWLGGPYLFRPKSVHDQNVTTYFSLYDST